MSFISSLLHKISFSSSIQKIDAFLLYPKLVIFENVYSIRVIDLETKNEEEFDDSFISHGLVDKILHDQLLWIILSTGMIIIIDVLNKTKIQLKSDGFANYRMQKLRIINNKMVLVSESGECLLIPCTKKDLQHSLDKGLEELNVTFEKIRISNYDLDEREYIIVNGLHIYIDSGSLVAHCPVTNITESLSSSLQICHYVPWQDKLILSNMSSMWLVDLVESNMIHEFEKDGSNYYPLKLHNNSFYYLQWDEMQVRIFSAYNVTEGPQNKDFKHLSDTSTIVPTSQDCLKNQLQLLVNNAKVSDDTEQVLTQSKVLFDKIDDLIFLVDIGAKLCQINFTYKSLLYPLQKRVFVSKNTELMNILTDILIKVDVLEYITFRGNSVYGSVHIFEQNFKQLCEIFISNADIDLASICWLKYSEMKVKLSPIDIFDIMNAVPQNIKISSLVIWLKNFVPGLLDENPYFIDVFVKWTTHRVFLLESSGYWPKIGLKFIDEIILILDSSLKAISIRPISMDELEMLKDHIHYVIELKDKYKINMLLNEFNSQSASEVGLIMLRRCYTEDLNAFVQDYLPIFATRYTFDVDDTLRSYIESEAATCGGGIDSMRLKILLNAVRSLTVKLECLLQVLKVLDVPWDETVINLALTAAASVHKDFTFMDADRTLAQEIKKELNYAKVKVVLKKYNFPLTCTDYILVIHKLMNAPIVDLNDLKTITGVMSAYTNYGNILYIDRCLRDCDTKVALQFFNNLPLKDKNIVLKTTATKFDQIIQGNTNNASLERNYLDFLKGTRLLKSTQVDDIENLYHLKNSYNLVYSINLLNIEKYCTEMASKWVYNDEVTASSGRGQCITRLSRTNQSRNSILISLLRRTSTSSQVRKTIEALIMFNNGKESVHDHDLTSVLTQFKEQQNSELLLKCYETLIELVDNCSEEHLHYLIKYLSILNAIINTDVVLKNLSTIWKFHYIFLPMSSVTAVSDLIEDFVILMENENENEIGSVDLTNKNDITVFRILGNLLERAIITGQQINEQYYTKKDIAAEKLIPKLIVAQDLDELLLTFLLAILGSSKEMDDQRWIIDVLQGHSESLPFGITCYLSNPVIRRTFAVDNVLPGSSASYPPQYILQSKFNINLTEMALSDTTEETWDVKVILFYVLRQYPETSFDRLTELCRKLNVSINDGLSLQLIALLTTWELNYKISNDELGCKQIYLNNDEQSLAAQCFLIWESIEDKTFLKDILNDFWKNGEVTLHGRLISINPFFYEVYVCIYHLIYGTTSDLKNKKAYFLLNFLKEYRRKSSPKQYEFELFSVKGMFPEIGYYRLPFHLFTRDDMWSNLKSEITLETYERWLPIVALLSLDADVQTAKDMICSNALKQTMTSRKRKDMPEEDAKENEPWSLTTREEPLLRAAHRCVRHIANMEWAGACLFYVLQGCARGADQVAAAQLCYQFSQRWAALQPGNRAVKQMERLHCSLSTRHALHKIEWARDEFLRLSAEPVQLIRALYLHSDFIEKISRYDVNRAANEIADKNGVNISSVRIQILESILMKSYKINKSNTLVGLDVQDLIIAKYILKATCPKMGAIYLSRIAFDDEGDFDKCKQLRALQCLMSVVDVDTAMKVTHRERDALWSSLLDLLFIVNLEKIDMPWIVAIFMQNKTRALEQLIQAAGSNVECLKVASELARRFGNIQIIRSLLPMLLRTSLHEQVIPLLLKVSSPPDDIIFTSWRAVILSPFQRADYPITERQKALCLTAINLLPVCPVIQDEDLLEIWKNCVRCKCFGLGCLVLPYISPQNREKLPELHKIDKRNLIASLKNLHSETFLVTGAMHVVENIKSRKYN